MTAAETPAPEEELPKPLYSASSMLNPVTRSQITFEPSFICQGEAGLEAFLIVARRWCTFLHECCHLDPKVADPTKIIQWGRSPTGDHDLAKSAVVRRWETVGPNNVWATHTGGPHGVLKVRPEDQPLPAAGQESVQDALIKMIEERRELGIRRYGRPLETFNGRDPLRDALEEAVDLAAYLMQCVMERDATKREEPTSAV